MWKRKRQGLGHGSVIERLRWRYREDGVGGLGGGNASTSSASSATQEPPDIPPVNGGPERSFESLSNATIDDPNDGGAGGVATGAAGAGQTQANLPADPNQRAGATAAAVAQNQPQWQGIMDAARAQGFQFGADVTNDRDALGFLLRQAQAARQMSVYEQLGRQLAPQAPQIQQYLQGQQQPAAAPAARPAWEAPEFDERWAALVEQDPQTGMYFSKPGVSPEIAQKVNTFVEWKKNYDRNPAAVLNSMVDARARDIAQTTFREQFQQQQREQTIQQIMTENSSWLYQVDQATGQRARDYMGNLMYSPTGAAYVQQLQAVRNMGVTDPRQQDMLAKQLVQGMMAISAQQQAQAANGQGTNPQTRQAVNQPNRNPAQANPITQRRADPAATEPSQVGLSLAERMQAALDAEGVTDADIMASAGIY